WAAGFLSWRESSPLWMPLMSERQSKAFVYAHYSGFYSSTYSCDVCAPPRHRFQRGQFWPLTALCICLLLAGRPGFANDPASLEPQTGPMVPVDQQSQTLLLRVEQQISAGHFIVPQDDNALQTWRVFAKSASPAAPGTHRALKEFVERMRSRAT